MIFWVCVFVCAAVWMLHFCLFKCGNGLEWPLCIFLVWLRSSSFLVRCSSQWTGLSWLTSCWWASSSTFLQIWWAKRSLSPFPFILFPSLTFSVCCGPHTALHCWGFPDRSLSPAGRRRESLPHRSRTYHRDVHTMKCTVYSHVSLY